MANLNGCKNFKYIPMRKGFGSLERLRASLSASHLLISWRLGLDLEEIVLDSVKEVVIDDLFTPHTKWDSSLENKIERFVRKNSSVSFYMTVDCS